jgi:chemotaxis protein MotB
VARKKKHPEHVNHERWLISYADFITLLFAFFVVMFAVSQVDTKKMGRFTESFAQAIGLAVTPDNQGLMPGEQQVSTPPDESERRTSEKGRRDALTSLEHALSKRVKTRPELGKLKVIRRGNELVLRMDAAVLFESGGDVLDENAGPALEAIADEVRERNVRVRVEGHTDDVPISTARYRSNWDLSTARATSVVAILAKAGKLAPSRLSAMGYAEFQPIAPNDTPEGRSQNRRVDFVLTIGENDLPATEVPAASAPSNPPATDVKAPTPSKE